MIPARILVTGGAGFIGSHTVDLLLQQDRQIVVLDNLFSGKLSNLNLNHPNLEFVEGDVLEYGLVEKLVAESDAVLHLAALVSVPESVAEPVYSHQVNVQGLLHVLKAIYQTRRPIRLVYASSAAVYGAPTQLPCDDAEPLKALPTSPYALQKINDEQYADLYARLYDVSNLGLRYFNVYGERQDPTSAYSGVISRFLAAYKKGEPLTIFGDGLQSRDFISITDVARANVLALQSDYTGVLNIATGKAQTLLDVVKCIETAGKKSAKINFEPARIGDVRESYATTELAAQKLGFKAEISSLKGLGEMV